MERVMGIEPTPPAWKAGALPLSYTRNKFPTRNQLSRKTPQSSKQNRPKIPIQHRRSQKIMAGAGFEPAKAEPPDLQSGPFGHSGIPPKCHLTDERHPFTERHLQLRCRNQKTAEIRKKSQKTEPPDASKSP